MPVLNVAAFALFQESGLTSHDAHLMVICLFIITVALVVLVICLVIGGGFAALLLRRVIAMADIAEKRTHPMLDKTNALLDLLNELAPKMKGISENAEQISATVRTKVDELCVTATELNDTVREINGRTRAQVSRVDGIVTDALVATEDISRTVQQGIKGPVRQIAGIIAGLRVGIETLIERSPFGRG